MKDLVMRDRGAFAGHRRDDRRGLPLHYRAALRELAGALRRRRRRARTSRAAAAAADRSGACVCGARASHSVAGRPRGIDRGRAPARTPRSATMATAKPRRRRQRCSRSTAGVSSSARNSAIATGMKTSCAKYSTAPTPRMATSQTALISLGSGPVVLHARHRAPMSAIH